MKTYKVHGRIRADIPVNIDVEEISVDEAIREAEAVIYEKCGLYVGCVIDDELYCDEIK